jgi:hypothetical protein
MSTPTTSKPALLYPVAAPPAQQNKSSSLGRLPPKAAKTLLSVFLLGKDRIPLSETTLRDVGPSLMSILFMFSLYSLHAFGKLVYFSPTQERYPKRNRYPWSYKRNDVFASSGMANQ